MQPTFRLTRDALRATRGFTLLEMVLAIVLFATGTIAVMEAIQRAHAGTTDGENLLIATHLAQRRLDELRNTTYTSLASEAKASVSSPSGFSRFSREVTITEPLTDLKQVIVTVFWQAPGGEADAALQTHLSRN